MKKSIAYKLLILCISLYLLVFCYAILDMTSFFGLLVDEYPTENSESISNTTEDNSNEEDTLFPSILDSEIDSISLSFNEDLDSNTISEIEPTPDIDENNKLYLTSIKTTKYLFKNLSNYFIVSSYNEFLSLNYDKFGVDISSLEKYDEDYFIDNSLLFVYGIRNNYYLDDFSYENFELKIYLKEKQVKYNNHCFYLLSANKEILENFTDIDFYLNDKEFIDNQKEESLYKEVAKHFNDDNYYFISNYVYDSLYLIAENKDDSEFVVKYLDDSFTIKNTSNLYIYNKDMDKLIDINNFITDESYNEEAHKKFVYKLIEKNAISKYDEQYDPYESYTNYGFYEIDKKIIFAPYFSSYSLIDGIDIYIDGIGFHYLTTNEISLYYNEEFLSLSKAYEDNLISKEFLEELAFKHNQNTYFKLADLYPLLNEINEDYSNVNFVHKNFYKNSYSTIEQSYYTDDSYTIKLILDKINNDKLTVTKNSNAAVRDDYYEIITDEWSLIIPYNYYNYKGLNLKGSFYDYSSRDYEECLNFKFEDESYNFYCNGEVISVDSSVLTSFCFKKIAYEYVYEIKENFIDTPKPIYIVEEDIIKYDDQYYKIIFKGEKIASLYKPIEKCHLTIKDENGYLCTLVYKKGTSINVSYLIKDFTFPFNKDMVLSYDGSDENISINDVIILDEDKTLYIKNSSE